MLRSALSSRVLYAALLPLIAGVAQAADLSSRYTDSNGDMVADAPTDESKWVDPATLIFAYTPVEDPAVYAKVWDGFLQHMEKVTGKKIRFFPVQSNAAQLEAMRAGRLHIAGFNTGSVPLAVNCAGFVPFTMMADKQGDYGYQMEIITHTGSGIDDVPGLKGHTLAFTSPTSNSGFKAPSALLKFEFNLEADKDFKTAFSGKHDNSIMGVVNRDYDAAAIANSVLRQMQARGMVKPEQYKSLYTSQTFPTTGYGYVYNLKPELAAKVREGFETFEWEGSALQAEFKNTEGEQFIPIQYAKHWDVVRKIDQAMDVSYECDK